MHERDYMAACTSLGTGADLAVQRNLHYTELMFKISKAMVKQKKNNEDEAGFLNKILKVLQILGQPTEVYELLKDSTRLIDTYQGPAIRKESAKVFHLTLQAMHFLHGGQVKQGKPCLKDLQSAIQILTNPETISAESKQPQVGDLFQWMPVEQLCLLVYLVKMIFLFLMI